jgi:hypothetical protein
VVLEFDYQVWYRRVHFESISDSEGLVQRSATAFERQVLRS